MRISDLITLCLTWKCFICSRRKTNWKYHYKDWRTPKAKRPGTGWQTWTAGKGIEGKRKRHHQSRIEFEKCQRFKKTRRKEKATNYQGMYFELKSSLKDKKAWKGLVKRILFSWSEDRAVTYLKTNGPKPSLKIGTANAICWNSLGPFRDYGLDHIF